MNFTFICPVTNEVFYTDAFQIVNNRGVREDERGLRSLDAEVALTDPCPMCGTRHVYDANELACPFSLDLTAAKDPNHGKE